MVNIGGGCSPFHPDGMDVELVQVDQLRAPGITIRDGSFHVLSGPVLNRRSDYFNVDQVESVANQRRLIGDAVDYLVGRLEFERKSHDAEGDLEVLAYGNLDIELRRGTSHQSRTGRFGFHATYSVAGYGIHGQNLTEEEAVMEAGLPTTMERFEFFDEPEWPLASLKANPRIVA